MLSDQFDIEFWRQRLTKEMLHRSARAGFFNVTGPTSIVALEDARKALDLSAEASWPTDVFIWAIGEPERRDVTKVGGVPYRPSGAEWPTSKDGRPATFLGQISFGESRDIVGDTPGDVLLVFCQDKWFMSEESLSFEWHPAGLVDLMAPDDCPPPEFPFFTGWGQRYRTIDYSPMEDIELDELHVINGTKIGGVPSRSLETPPKIDSEKDGRYIAQLYSVQSDDREEFPLCNIQGPIDTRRRGWKDKFYFNMVDNGVIRLYLDSSDRVVWDFHCA